MTIDERSREFAPDVLGDPRTPEIFVSPDVRVAGFEHAVLLDVDDQVYALPEATADLLRPPGPSTATGIRAIWLPQFDQVPHATVAALTVAWAGPIYVKALDGVDWMARFDPSPLAVRQVRGAPSYWTWPEQGWVPWTVPRGGDTVREGQLAGQLAEAAGEVILDLSSPGEGWAGTTWGAEHFVDAYFAQTTVLPHLYLDHRRLRAGFPPDPFLERIAGLLAMVDWTNRPRPCQAVLEEAETVLAPLQRPIEYVLPGHARAEELQEARRWCADRGAPVSLWAWHTLLPENWP